MNSSGPVDESTRRLGGNDGHALSGGLQSESAGDTTASVSPGGAAVRATVVDGRDSSSRGAGTDTGIESRIEAALSAVGDDEPSVDPLIGRLIDNRFEILSRLGAGGMGVVYRARQLGIDRPVAVKTLLKDRAQDHKVVQRFKNEARAVSKLNHPNTIRIHDFGQMEDGTLYFAMELLEGRSLDRAIRSESPMPARRTLHILAQMADSLAEAHGKGIVHRDLKPENVYLCPVGDDPDFVKVLDFGVARMREQDRSQGTVTQAGVIFGTPRYMAPEQCRTMAVDARADIYALGVICFEMLVGRTPFDADNPLALLMKHLQDEVPAMSSLRPDVDVPDEVELLVRRCLEKSPEKRFQSAAALAAEVRALVDRLDGRYERVVFVDRAVSASVQSPKPAVDAAVRPFRNRFKTIVALAGLTGLAGAAAAAYFLLSPASPASSVPSGSANSSAGRRSASVAREKPGAAVDTAVPKDGNPASIRQPDRPPPVETVRIKLESEPSGATVFKDGEDLGHTPVNLELRKADVEVRFDFELEGYAGRTMSARLDRDASLSAVLTARPPEKSQMQKPSSRHAKNPAVKRGASSDESTPAPPPPEAGFQKVGGETKKPVEAPGKVGDLKKF